MKEITRYIIAAMTAAMIFQSCGSDDGPEIPAEPEYEVYTFNRNDSAAFCDILRKANAEYCEMFLVMNNMRLDSILSWTPCVRWILDRETKEARISQLTIEGQNGGNIKGEISERILELDSLKFLNIKGLSIGGTLPGRKDCRSVLEYIDVYNTSITDIQDEVFQYPRLGFMIVRRNYQLKFPDGIRKRKDFNKEVPVRFYFQDNGFTGTCPMDIPQQINLEDNDFTAVSWEGMKDKDYKEMFRIYRQPGPFLMNNKITGEIPDYILADTLATIYVVEKISSQQRGYGISNRPSDGEIMKMKEEYRRNHPEEVKDFVVF